MKEFTIQDCIDKYDNENQFAVLGNGKVLGFQKEEIPTQTANPSGDK